MQNDAFDALDDGQPAYEKRGHQSRDSIYGLLNLLHAI